MALISIVLPFAISIPGICGDVQDHVTITNENLSTDTTRTANKSISAGPVVFYWHGGTGSSPDEALTGLGIDTIDAIKAEGGIVAAPYHDPGAGLYPWFLTTHPLQSREADG